MGPRPCCLSARPGAIGRVDGPVPAPNYGTEAPTLREQRTAVLAAPPGIGPVLAARLLDQFGGLRGALDADADALGAVPGIGEALAARLAAVLR